MAHPRVSLSKQFINFTSSCGGLDLTLRLIQALAIVAAEVTVDHVTVARCTTAMSQLALGRRYLRVFSFIECFERVRDLLTDTGDFASGRSGALLGTMDLVESSCLGIYLLLESSTMVWTFFLFTIIILYAHTHIYSRMQLHDMDVWPVAWYMPVLLEGNKFWFYAICTSIFRSIWKLLFASPAAQNTTQKNNSEGDEKKKEPEESSPSSPSTVTLLRRIIVDCCDLTLPASFLGWIVPGDLGVGAAMVVSTVLAWPDVWSRVQG
ncbi:hypothetical protein F5884DRAFT_888965 [Xylogone sp. PMI_703]|nr:hypothetical protein F5884DRAFT_888965 [Xylogone sp. PMI_703]